MRACWGRGEDGGEPGVRVVRKGGRRSTKRACKGDAKPEGQDIRTNSSRTRGLK